MNAKADLRVRFLVPVARRKIKRFQKFKFFGYQGRAVVVVSCVTKDEPHLVHPHNLVGKECRNGVCTLVISPETMTVQFQNLGIQCVKKRDIESSLRLREQIKVDPFRHGYAHRNQPSSIDLNAVRLCFQIYLEHPKDGKFTIPLRPVVSDVIYDKKAMDDLAIVQPCSCVSHVDGGRQMILLCEKVAKEDIEVHFYEEDSQGKRVWCAKADFQPSQVHKQTAITFKTPPYRTLDVSEPVRVSIQLYRPSDRMTSEPLPFEYVPLDSVFLAQTDSNKRKRATFDQSCQRILGGLTPQDKMVMRDAMTMNTFDPIKTEPRAIKPDPIPIWNIPPPGLQGAEAPVVNWNNPSHMAEAPPQLLDFDNHQINSGNLQIHLNEINIPNLGPDFSNLSLTGIDINTQGENMSSDSLTNIVNAAVDRNLGVG